MPLVRYTFNPGINKEGTDYTNEGAWNDSNFVRFRAGRPEKIGGWVKRTSETYIGTARKLLQWSALDNDKFIAVATHKKLYILQGDSYYDITPIRKTSTNSITFSATNGSSTITATDSSHGAVIGDFVTISGAVSLGGNITATVLNQEYEVVSVPDTNTYTIVAKDTDGNAVTANSSDSGNGGSGVDGSYQINTGLDTFVDGVGYGSGTWGEGSWGSSTTGFSSQLRLWSLDNYGEDLVSCGRLDAIYYWDKSDGLNTRALALSDVTGASNPPTKALQVIVSEKDKHLIAIGCNPFGSTDIDFMQIRWSDQANPVDWTPETTNSAGDVRLSSGSQIITALKTRQEIIIWTDTSLYTMRFVGDPYVFAVDLISEGVSIISPNAMVNANNIVYFMDQDNFYIYSGGVRTMPCSVRAYVFEDFNSGQAYKIFATRNAQFNEVSWFYCSASSDEIDRYVTFNYLENNWTIGQLSRTAWLDSGVTSRNPIATSNNYIYNHEIGYDDDGSAMNAYVESADFDIDDGDHFSFIRRLVPDIKFIGTSTAPEVTYTLKTRSSTSGSLVSATTTSVGNTTEITHVRARGRQMRLRIENTDANNGWRLGDVRLDVRPDGRR